ncbi:hypothetical protein FV141_09270 [Dermacoccus abyssi]|uniref:Beta-lactamase-related domain-containing protein n=1 Tax=Dermacoccus abyssi TaxID=322596 RepID=A0ABX5ZDL1_9MICO|nr:hypothetical protein FV141_09270 [Dermacoccus abyssi]
MPNDETAVRDLLTHRSGLSAREGLDAAERYDNSSRAVTTRCSGGRRGH